MRTTYINSTLQAGLSAQQSNKTYFDPLGNVQGLESLVMSLEDKYKVLETKNDKLIYRQSVESDKLNLMLQEANLEIAIESLMEAGGIGGGLIGNAPIVQSLFRSFDWNFIEIAGLNSAYDKIEVIKNFKMDMNNFYCIFENEDCMYTSISLKLPDGVATSLLEINFPFRDLKSLRVRSEGSDIEELVGGMNDFEPAIVDFFTGKSNLHYINTLSDSGQPVNYFNLILANKKVGNKYYLNTQVRAIDVPKYIKSNPLTWESNGPVSGLFLSTGLDPSKCFFEGQITVGKTSYPIELSDFQFSNELSFGRIKILKQSGDSTIGTTVYPVDISRLSEIKIYNSLESKTEVLFLVSLNKQDWYSPFGLPDSFEYPVGYSFNPKELYFQFLGIVDNLYIKYPIKKDINSRWLLSNDGRLYFNGTGIGIKNPEKTTIYGTLKGIWDLSSLDAGISLGGIGVD